jgi:hypothetical protein
LTASVMVSSITVQNRSFVDNLHALGDLTIKRFYAKSLPFPPSQPSVSIPRGFHLHTIRVPVSHSRSSKFFSRTSMKVSSNTVHKRSTSNHQNDQQLAARRRGAFEQCCSRGPSEPWCPSRIFTTLVSSLDLELCAKESPVVQGQNIV